MAPTLLIQELAHLSVWTVVSSLAELPRQPI